MDRGDRSPEEPPRLVVLPEGSATFEVGDTAIEARAGHYLFGPRDIPHRYTVGDAGCRMLFICTPAGFEDLVVAMSEPACSRTLPPRSDEGPDMARVGAIAEAHGCALVGQRVRRPGLSSVDLSPQEAGKSTLGGSGAPSAATASAALGVQLHVQLLQHGGRRSRADLVLAALGPGGCRDRRASRADGASQLGGLTHHGLDHRSARSSHPTGTNQGGLSSPSRVARYD
jgi:hypothetical protein